MAEERVQRRLAAILAADVAGYSRLMGKDEEDTLATLTAHRTELIEPCIAEHRGRVVKTTGDGLLAEFASVVDAVRCAVAFQGGMRERNTETPEDRRIDFRIGINIGDVIVQDDDVFGDGVNVASRLEGLAEPGSIVVSGMVHEAVRAKLDFGYEDLGSQAVKNIAEPVRVYRLNVEMGNVAEHTLHVTAPDTPERPSIAVLPFTNISDDPEQEYFADGITEDLITDLSRISSLFVVARNSSFAYKEKSPDLRRVGRELGVRYVLEGSVRKARGRVRINAQLIDTATGGHLWAERYDGDFDDIFALQDEITGKIVSALRVKLTAGEQEHLARRYTDNQEAYDYFLRGRAYDGLGTKEAITQARNMFEKAIELDPTFAGAYATLSYTSFRDWFNQWSGGAQALDRSLVAARKAVALDDALPLAHMYLGWAYLFRAQHEEAISEGERALSLDPDFAEGYARLGQILNFAGRPEEGVGLVKKAMRLDPHYPPTFLNYLGLGYYAMGRYEEAIAALKRSLTRNPNAMVCNIWLTAAHSELGRMEEAKAEMGEALKFSSHTSVKSQRERMPFKDRAVKERYTNALRKAGLPA